MKKLNIPPAYFFSSLIAIVLIYFFDETGYILSLPYNLSGIILLYIGLVMNKKARDLFGRYETSHQFQESSFLIKEGIFLKTRNPMYLGMFIFILGFAICFGNILSLIVPFAFIFLMQVIFIPYEERKMEDTFGKDYLDYKKKVGRWF